MPSTTILKGLCIINCRANRHNLIQSPIFSSSQSAPFLKCQTHHLHISTTCCPKPLTTVYTYANSSLHPFIQCGWMHTLGKIWRCLPGFCQTLVSHNTIHHCLTSTVAKACPPSPPSLCVCVCVCVCDVNVKSSTNRVTALWYWGYWRNGSAV